MEEGFNYPDGTSLATNTPWTGNAGLSVGVVSGNLSLTNVRATVPAGNMVQITGGTSRAVYRNFSSNAVGSGALYCSALIRCLQPPTNSQFIAALLAAGRTSHNSDADPLDLNVTAVTNGNAFSLSLTTAGSDPATWRQGLPANSTHLIVLKYIFGSAGQSALYVDPVPGGSEPASPTIITEQGDSGTGATNVQVILLQSSSSPGQGSFELDTLRIGTNWSDVTPAPSPLSLAGPENQAVCYGDNAAFSVVATGTPPYTYQWRTNGMPVSGATNSTLLLNNPGSGDLQGQYDVVVNDAFGSVTSQVATLSFTTNAASIVTPPANQVLLPGDSNATFTVTATGDAPVSYQWRNNGVDIPDATNTSYTLSDPALTNGPLAIDVVISNPCGSVVSTPKVGVMVPNVFNVAYDAGPGFFGGENIICTNTSGLSLCAWSSPDLSASVTAWNLEGPLSEFPLGATGKSRYGITLNPATSPGYYIIAATNTGPYTPAEALSWLTTEDFVSFNLVCSNTTISVDGVFSQSAPATNPPPSVQITTSNNGLINLNAVCATNVTYVVESSPSLVNPVWTPVLTNNTGGSGLVAFQASTTGIGSQFYRLVFP